MDDVAADFRSKASRAKTGFQAMGLSFNMLKGITKRGYKIPTPVQRKTIPLILEGRDVVAMAKTGMSFWSIVRYLAIIVSIDKAPFEYDIQCCLAIVLLWFYSTPVTRIEESL